MIVDSLKNAKSYYGVSELVEKGLKFLENTDLKNLAEGKYEIDGKKVYANVMSHTGKTLENKKWEAHNKYIDIQYIVKGTETMLYEDVKNMEVISEYNEEKDIYLLKGEGMTLNIKEGYFAMFLPQDAHAPNIVESVPADIKKVVVKVLVD